MSRKLLLLCGIASSALYVAADVIATSRYPGYSAIDQTISELSAFGAPSRPVMLPLVGIYGPLLLLFAIGVWFSADGRRALRATAVLLGLYAFACIPFASMHTREVLAAGGGTRSDSLHILMTTVDSVLLVAIIVVGGRAFGKMFRLYSAITLTVMFTAGLLAAMYGPGVALNQPTQWLGITERVMIFSAMVWLAVFAAAVLRTTVSRVRSPRRGWSHRHAAPVSSHG